MERKEVTLYAMTVDDSRSVPIQAFDNGDGSYSLRVSQGDGVSQSVSLTNRSGTIGADSTSQQIMAANLNRKYLLVQNVSTANLWINFGGAATESQPSIKLLINGSYIAEASAIPTDSVTIIGASAGLEYTAKEG